MAVGFVHWAGGKGRQLADLLPLIPTTRVYVEPFGGGGSVLLNRPRCEIEVYNDLDRQLVNLFRVVRDDDSYAQFRRRVALVPYSRTEFERALRFDDLDSCVDKAVAFYTVLNQSVSGKRLAGPGDWSRGRTINNADSWFSRQHGLVTVHERIRSVQLECRDAIDVVAEWDSPETTFYCDPPYVLDSRGRNKYYAVEPGDDYHKVLVDCLLDVSGMVVLSGYFDKVYSPLVRAGWHADTFSQHTTMDIAESFKGRTRRRVEVVYRNPRACEFGIKRPLFNAASLSLSVDGEGV